MAPEGLLVVGFAALTPTNDLLQATVVMASGGSEGAEDASPGHPPRARRHGLLFPSQAPKGRGILSLRRLGRPGPLGPIMDQGEPAHQQHGENHGQPIQ